MPAAAKSASIFVKSGALASIGGGATWSAYNGIDISSTLIVKGAGAALDCNAGGTVGLKLNDGATIRFDAADASLAFLQKPAFASGTVNVDLGARTKADLKAFAKSSNPYLVTWGSQPTGTTFVLDEAHQRLGFRIKPDATGLRLRQSSGFVLLVK